MRFLTFFLLLLVTHQFYDLQVNILRQEYKKLIKEIIFISKKNKLEKQKKKDNNYLN